MTTPPAPDPLDPALPSTSPPMSVLVYRKPVEPPAELPVLSNRTIVWAAVTLIVLGVGVAAGLLVAFGDGGHAGRLDAIKTAGTIVLGTGGAAALWLTARRQRTSELSLNQARAAHAATVADAEARRITDLYGKAADQLGAAQAPVRLAGLYALERLAQDNPAQRQTIVDLLCAYLRMPYEPPSGGPARRPAARPSGVPRPLLGSSARRRASVRLAPPSPPADVATGGSTEAEQERQVRRTAQTILFRHLKIGAEENPVHTFWSSISLDLTGALLGPANLLGCRVAAADFTGATFTGDVWFGSAHFGLNAVFTGVRFAGEVSFSDARFDYDARFDGATFDRFARFGGVEFRGSTTFARARFRSPTVFTGTKFDSDAYFASARFDDRAEFGKTRFAARGVFADASFAGNTYFHDAEFTFEAGFSGARFEGAFTQFGGSTLAEAGFHSTRFGGETGFTATRFTGEATFGMAKFGRSVEFTRAWFDGQVNFGGTWFTRSVVFDEAMFAGDTRFHECHFERTAEFHRTRFAADVWFDSTEFVEGAGFAEAVFCGRALLVGARFGGVSGFRRARFERDVIFKYIRFGDRVSFTDTHFAHPPQIRTVWVRVDGRKPGMDSTWPPGTEVRDAYERPYVASEGQWGVLVPVPSDDAAGSPDRPAGEERRPDGGEHRRTGDV
ncbi:pentapeptide repeat-containing protein [Amycolatopsis regifaucium]|uniref:Pentapeptide repeat-containing protein n=1 Tax=Amycolatopsis regifaucium TaxID=546365 RepID=A0A154MNZ6_9PSEU|nr:pentapeptide repeat-containing protein [Amycolatopsis regifaucium]KZB86022.1 hypothetical protein AVL48_27905 [Amycolatopsis regifaucium]OKA04913.1 hypothetical protein ATP06_0227980 [Amycolatopsis regifaucium]